MRILKFMSAALFIALIIGGIGFLIARESMLIYAVAQIRTSISILKQIEKNPKAYALQCRQMGVSVETDVIDKLQLRFVSPTEYVVEVVCAQFSLDPIVIERRSLPKFVLKLPGSSGIIWGNSPSALGISVFGRKRAVVVENKEIFYSDVGENFIYGMSPVSSCQAYGFSCCQKETQIGQGSLFNGVSDCPATCYSQCVSRPMVLSFASDPFMDFETRVATVQKGEIVTFSYVAQANSDDEIGTIELSTGDGQKYTATEMVGSFTHSYQCLSVSCTYQATIRLVNSMGIESALLPINIITIKVSN